MTIETFLQLAADKGLSFALLFAAIWWLNKGQSKWMAQAQSERVQHIDYMEATHKAAQAISDKRHDECEADRSDLRKRFYERIESEVNANRQAIIAQTKAASDVAAATILAHQQKASLSASPAAP